MAAVVVVSHLSAKTSVHTRKSPEVPDVVTQIELVRKETLIQVVGCSEYLEPSLSGKVSTCTGCAQVDNLLQQVAELQEAKAP